MSVFNPKGRELTDRAIKNRRVRAALIRLGRLRQGDRCFHCHEPFTASDPLTLDHLIPISKGGRTNSDNIVLSHLSCNNRKADTMPDLG